MGVFDAAEHANRVGAVQARMGQAGYDALIVVDPANLYYLTGYDAWSFYMPQALLVPADGPPHLIARTMDAQGAQNTATLPIEQVHGYPEDLVHQPDVHPWEWITARGRDLGVLPTSGQIAAELDAHFFSPRGYLALAAGLPEATLVDSGELVNWVRLIKSPHEQQLMREAGRIATTVMEVALAGLEVGRRQCDVVAEIQYAQAVGVDDLGGDYAAIVPLLPTGPSAGTPHLTWSESPLRAGEATALELAGTRHRYHVPLARTVSLGTPPARLAACAEAVAEGCGDAVAALRPGATGADAHAAFTAAITRHGLAKESRVGYSIGIGYPPDWGERTVSLRAGETTELAPGMCFHLILGMWMDGWGYETSESVLVTEDGPELLTEVNQGLVVKP